MDVSLVTIIIASVGHFLNPGILSLSMFLLKYLYLKGTEKYTDVFLCNYKFSIRFFFKHVRKKYVRDVSSAVYLALSNVDSNYIPEHIIANH